MQIMKTSVGLVLLLSAVLFAYAARAEESCTKIVATGHPEYPPMAFKEGDRIDGAAALLVGEIAKELKVPLETKYMGSWSEAQSATREGKADMIIGVYSNDERTEYLDYVDPPFAYDPVQVFVANDQSFDFKGPENLIGKKGIANAGESFGTTFDDFLKEKLTVTRVDGLAAGFDALLSGDADYLIAAYYPATAALVRSGLDDKVQPLEPALLSEELFVAFSKKSPCVDLSSEFGEGITEMTEDGRFRELVRNALRQWGADESFKD
jgi:polar amino acid transport system substrate-binding protein